MKPEELDISSDKFIFVEEHARQYKEKELETKPISYWQDAFHRFKKNKGSIVAAVIIFILILFAVIGPLVTPYKVSYQDAYFKFLLPKNQLFTRLGWNFWDGCKKLETTEQTFYYHYSKGVETGHPAIKNEKYKIFTKLNPNRKEVTYYQYRYDTYQGVGTIFMSVTEEQYKAIQQYQDVHQIQVIYPITQKELRPQATQDAQDANFWYQTTMVNGKTQVVLDEHKRFKNIYKPYSGVDQYTSKMRIEGEGAPLYDYAYTNQTGYEVRVNYYEYYIYTHTTVYQDNIKSPSFLFGTTNSGQDIFTCLASGARFSFILAICVAFVNLLVGAIYGAIEGYYGGKIDLLMERLVEILSAVPFMIVITLLKYHMMGSSQVLILFIAFFLTGWIGMAGRTRMQFYRFKKQEYVLAAKTMGAKDWRIMLKHIFPNSIGTLITSCVLVIPSMIFSETSLSYLGIINLNSGNMTSVGTLLANAQPYLTSYPHMVIFPSVFICLLMLSFNLFGNGLRDAFNPSLRGTEE